MWRQAEANRQTEMVYNMAIISPDCQPALRFLHDGGSRGKISTVSSKTEGNFEGESAELARAVPIHVHDGWQYFVRIGEIHDPLQGKFVEALRGSACPVLLGEGPLAFAWDWQAWIEDR
jgi:hypothetical protein